jgi:hypothetical protein
MEPANVQYLTLWQNTFSRVLGSKGNRLPSDVKIIFRGAEIENLCRTRVMVWNHGQSTTRGSDLVAGDPLRIELGSGAEVLDATIKAHTTKSNNARVEVPERDERGKGSSQVRLSYDYLNARDGFLVEIFHTDAGKAPILAGSVQDMPQGFRSYGRCSWL